MGTRCADHVTPLYPQKLALTSPTGGGRSVSIVRSRRMAKHERTQRRRPRGKTRHTWEEGTQKIVEARGIERDGVRIAARDRERWRVVC